MIWFVFCLEQQLQICGLLRAEKYQLILAKKTAFKAIGMLIRVLTVEEGLMITALADLGVLLGHYSSRVSPCVPFVLGFSQTARSFT